MIHGGKSSYSRFPFSPSYQSWCASGNCLSLNHEYDKAIQAFKRAIQLAPESDYAYTLLGNEYSLIDELERAMSCFRKAIQLNPRSYKAW